MKYVLALIGAVMLVCIVQAADDSFLDRVKQLEALTADASQTQQAQAEPARDSDPFTNAVAAADPKKPAEAHRCPCGCSICVNGCQCAYPNECSELKWIVSEDDPSGYLLVTNKHVWGGLYPSGKYRAYRSGEWGALCEPPIARPKPTQVCGPNGCKMTYSPGVGGCASGNCGTATGGCASGSCGSAGGGCASCGGGAARGRRR